MRTASWRFCFLQSVQKKRDDEVIGATVNSTGTLTIRADKIGSDTVLSQIVKMVAGQ